MRLALAAIALAACGDPPPLTIQYALATDQQLCTTMAGGSAQSCSDVALPCDTYLSLRIVEPADPTQAYLSVCKPVSGRKNLCDISGIAVPEMQLPAKTLEVQVAIYPTSELTDTDGDGSPDCPPGPPFADDGLPENGTTTDGPVPAIGGMAYYHVGDTKTIVPLGCTSQSHLDACLGVDTVAITATAIDFDTDLAVSDALALELELRVGEPRQTAGNAYVLDPSDTTALDLTTSQIPSWAGDVMQTFDQFACVDVLDESAPPFTPVLTCKRPMAPVTSLDFQAVRIPPATLTRVLMAATGQPGVPADGITIGIVLQQDGTQSMGATVTSSDPNPTATIGYLSSDGTTLVSGGTKANGIFVAQGQAFGTTFTADPVSAIGGDVEGKVTGVVLQYQMSMGN